MRAVIGSSAEECFSRTRCGAASTLCAALIALMRVASSEMLGPSPFSSLCGGPERLGSLLIHLLNLYYSANGDRVTPQRDFSITLPEFGNTNATTATILAYDADTVSIPVRRTNGMISLTVPELRVWAIIALAAK